MTPTTSQALPTRRRSFVRGLRVRSPLVLLAGLGCAAALLAGLHWFVASGAFTAIPEGAMLRIPNDDYVHTSYLLADLARRPPTGPVVYLFGGSGAMELMNSEASLGSAVSEAAGTPVRVVRLATHNQSPAQTLAMVDSLPPGRGLVAIGVSGNRFTTSPQDDRDLLADRQVVVRETALRRFLARYTSVHERLPGVLPGALQFLVSYTRQRATLAKPWLSSLTYKEHYIDRSYRPSMLRRYAGARGELKRELPLYDRWAAYDRAALAEAADVARQKGYRVAFFEQPLAPEATGPHWESFLRRYRADVGGLADRLGVPYLAGVQAASDVQATDFGDLFHLNEDGRDRWTAPFARALARALQGSG